MIVFFVTGRGRPEPEPTCLEFIRLSGLSNDPAVPIIIFSGQTTKRNVIMARDLGCTEIIAKPVTTAQVFDKLNSALYAPRSFIAQELYTGPDRRRRSSDSYAGVQRRSESALKQDEIDRLLEGHDVTG